VGGGGGERGGVATGGGVVTGVGVRGGVVAGGVVDAGGHTKLLEKKNDFVDAQYCAVEYVVLTD
jgi:hypothetical protein